MLQAGPYIKAVCLRTLFQVPHLLSQTFTLFLVFEYCETQSYSTMATMTRLPTAAHELQSLPSTSSIASLSSPSGAQFAFAQVHDSICLVQCTFPCSLYRRRSYSRDASSSRQRSRHIVVIAVYDASRTAYIPTRVWHHVQVLAPRDISPERHPRA